MLETILACFITAWATSYFVKRRRFFTLYRKIPTPITIPFFQEVCLLLWYRFNIIKAFDFLTNKNGPIFRLCGRGFCVFVGSPELVQTLFTHPKLLNRGPAMDGVAELVGKDGLFSATAEEGKTVKRGFLKSFNMATPKAHIENIQLETNKLLEDWKKVPETSWVEAIHALEKVTTHAVVRGYILPKTTWIVAVIITVHRDPTIYPDPLRFDPDRFLPGNVEKRSKYAYIPFAAGPRACPGYRYALHGAIYMVAAIIRNFKVYTKYQSVQELDGNLDITTTMHDTNNFPLRLERRTIS